MKAFVCQPTGKAIFVTGDYKTVENLMRYGVRPYIKEDVDVEIFYNWDNRYGEPDKVISIGLNP